MRVGPGVVALAIAALSLGPASAQQRIVSPTTAASVDGSSQSAMPWNSVIPCRHLQIHSDIGAIPKLFSRIAFRRSAEHGNGSGTRSVDFELFLGGSVPWNQATFVIGNNYTGPRTLVMARKTLVFGPLVGTTNPAPFETKVPFDQPYFYLGTSSFAWEAAVYGNVANGSFAAGMDADQSSYVPVNVYGGGTGCMATGQLYPMAMILFVADVAGTFTLGGILDFAPKTALAAFVIGATNPSLSVPGLCGPLYTDLAVSFPLGLTNARGLIGETAGNQIAYPGSTFTVIVPNTFPGAVIYTQAHALDFASAQPIPVVNSPGRQFTVPLPDTTKTVQVTSMYNFDGGPTGNAGVFFAGRSVGFGLVVEFTY